MESTPTAIPPLAGGSSLRIPMAEREYHQLGEVRHAEYADGLLVVNPPTRSHERVVRRLAAQLEAAVPDTHEVFTGWGWRLPAGSERLPDLMVVDREAEDDTILINPPPLLVVEVTSPSTADIDHGTKVDEYGTAGAGWYWIVDPHQIVVMAGDGARLREVQRITGPETAAGPWPVPLDPSADVR